MEYFLMPIDRDDYYSANTQGGVGPWTYVRSTGEPHGHGRLDMALNREGPIYSMTDGKVIGVGHFSGDDAPITYCNIEYYDTTLNEKVVIRYLHGDYIVQENQEVSCGQQIGTIGNNDLENLQHLHIDFQDTPPYYYERNTMVGTLDFSQRTFTYKNVVYNLKDRVDLNKIGMWNQQMGLSASNTSIGYCWLIFAQNDQHLSPTPPGEKRPIDRSVYDNNDYWSGDSTEGVNAYFTKNLSTNFLGPCPSNWDEYESSECSGFRAAVAIGMHEFSIFGPFITLTWAKLLRATIIGSSYHHTNSNLLLTWIKNATILRPGWIDTWDAVDQYGRKLNGPDSYYCQKSYLQSSFGDEAWSFLMAYYNNLKYADIWGVDLSTYCDCTLPNAKENLIAAALKSMNGAAVGSSGYWSMIRDAYFVINWDPHTGTDRGKNEEGSSYLYAGHLVTVRGTPNKGGGTIDQCYTQYLE